MGVSQTHAATLQVERLSSYYRNESAMGVSEANPTPLASHFAQSHRGTTVGRQNVTHRENTTVACLVIFGQVVGAHCGRFQCQVDQGACIHLGVTRDATGHQRQGNAANTAGSRSLL